MLDGHELKSTSESNTYYIYNSGVDDREIFQEEQDYQTFINILKSYLSPIVSEQIAAVVDTRPFRQRQRQQMNLNNDLKLYSYCLTPTSFHLLLRQDQPQSVSNLLRRICTSYVIYFNKKYRRQGTLFKGTYRIEVLSTPEKIVNKSRQIHLLAVQVRKMGPFSTVSGSVSDYPYSSFSHFHLKQSSWVDTQSILDMFGQLSDLLTKFGSYVRFVETVT